MLHTILIDQLQTACCRNETKKSDDIKENVLRNKNCVYSISIWDSPNSETSASEFLVECLTRRNWVTMLSKHLLGVQSFGLLNIGSIWLEIGSALLKKAKLSSTMFGRDFPCEKTF